jgi:hypothetical protein
MKKLFSLLLFASVVALVLIVSQSAQAQRVIVTRATLIATPYPTNTIISNNGYWKWSNRHQKYIWVTKSTTRFRFHKGYRVRI